MHYFVFHDLARSPPPTQTPISSISYKPEVKNKCVYSVRFNSTSGECSTSCVCITNAAVCSMRCLEVQGCCDESQCCFGSGAASLTSSAFSPARTLQQEPRLTRPTGCGTRGQRGTFAGIKTSLSWPEDRWRSPRRSRGKGDTWPAL